MSRNVDGQSLQPKGEKQGGPVLHLKAYNKSHAKREGCQQKENNAIENNNLIILGKTEVWKERRGRGRSHLDPPIHQQFSTNQDCLGSFCKTQLSPIQSQLNSSEGQHTRFWTNSVVQTDKPFKWKIAIKIAVMTLSPGNCVAQQSACMSN